MKNRWWFGILTSLAAGIALAAPPARAQFDIDPDHFDSPSIVPFDQPRTKANSERAIANVHYEGRFTLPYSVQCNGKRLRPGKYSISLRADGKVAQATLNQKGETIAIGGVVQKNKPAGREVTHSLWNSTEGRANCQRFRSHTST